MKAAVCKKSGPPEVIQFRETVKPVPLGNEILVKIYASSVTRGDVRLRKIPRLVLYSLGLLFGFKPMEITGVEFAGIVEDTGRDVIRFKKGDHVFGTTTGLKYGGNAEYVCVPEERKHGVVLKKPDNLSFIESAAVPVGAMTALHNLRKAKIQSGQKILVYGASGSVGTYAVQIAKYFGAEVTAVCSTPNIEMVTSIGADTIIDYTKDDFTQAGAVYDAVFDAVGKISKTKCKKILKEHGIYLTIKYPTSEKVEYLNFIKTLIEAGKLKPVIDRTYFLENIIEAHRYVEKGHKRGNVAITVCDEKTI